MDNNKPDPISEVRDLLENRNIFYSKYAIGDKVYKKDFDDCPGYIVSVMFRQNNHTTYGVSWADFPGEEIMSHDFELSRECPDLG